MTIVRGVSWAVLALFGGLVLIGLALWLWLLSTLPNYERDLVATGLGAPTVIKRDSYGIPHITAETYRDAAFALGYAQAQDRMWQLELLRRAATGRTAEVMGRPLLSFDIRARIRLQSAAMHQASYAGFSDPMRHVADAFASGVNLAIKEGQAARSPEWALLGHTPAPWTGADVMSLTIAARDIASTVQQELIFENRKQALTDAEFQMVHEPLPACFPTSYEDGAASPPATPFTRATCKALLAHETGEGSGEGVGTSDPNVPDFGTNLFVAGRDATATGKAVLAVDPHLPAQAPGVIYPVSISLPDRMFAGGAWIGTPVIVFGHNDRIAWGMTHLYVDAADYVVERIHPANPDAYLTPDGPQPFEWHTETFDVKDGAPVTVRYRTSRNGIIVSDPWLSAPDDQTTTDTLAPDFKIIEQVYGPGHVVALKQPDATAGNRSLEALFRLSQSRSWDEAGTALSLYDLNNNFVYADVDGNIGLQMGARVPIREETDQWHGQRPARGWLGEGVWTGFAPYSALPSLYNPPKGWLADANSRAVLHDFPHRLADVYSPPWRALRASARVGARRDHTVESFKDIQLDFYSTKADWLLDHVADMELADERSKDAMAKLLAWDRVMAADRSEPLLYSVFAWALQHRLINRRYPELASKRADVLLLGKLIARDHEWCDDPATDPVEDCTDAVGAAMDMALDRIIEQFGPDPAEWRWGAARRIVFPALYSWDTVPPLRDWINPGLPYGGSEATLNRAASPRSNVSDKDILSELKHEVQSVAPFRMVIDLSDLKASTYSAAPGLSVNAVSRHWDDLLLPWSLGSGFKLHGADLRGAKVTTLTPPAPSNPEER